MPISPTSCARQPQPKLRLAVCFMLLVFMAPAFAAYVTDRVELPLFAAPRADAEVRAFVPAGEKVRELERRGDFARVKTEAGDEGWLALEHLSEEPVGATREGELNSLNEALSRCREKTSANQKLPRAAALAGAALAWRLADNSNAA